MRSVRNGPRTSGTARRRATVVSTLLCQRPHAAAAGETIERGS
jgi:hypothetical protein